MTQIRPDELIRILRGELEAIGAGGGVALLGYSEAGLFAGGQVVAAGTNSIGMGDAAAIGAGADYSVIGGGRANTVVAGADYSVIGGGYNNSVAEDYGTIAGGRDGSIVFGATHATICGGRDNTISNTEGDYSVIGGGYNNEIARSRCFIGSGEANIIEDGHYNVICGGHHNSMPAGAGSSSTSVISGGYYNTIVSTADHAAIPGGLFAKADKYGQLVFASWAFDAAGDAQGTVQISLHLEQASHVVNTWYNLLLANHMHIAASTVWTIHCLVTGTTQDAAQQWGYELIGLIERDNANNTTLAGQTKRVIFESDANYDAQLVADDVNEALVVQVRRTGGIDYNIRWLATIRTSEITYL